MTTELIHRNQTTPTQPASRNKPSNLVRNSTTPFRYMLQKQRFVFVLVGIVIATLFFNTFPISSSSSQEPSHGIISDHVLASESTHVTRRVLYEAHPEAFRRINVAGKIPLGVKRKSLRIVVTGGAGFVGSHLVDRLIGRGDSVIVVDNFFTGRKENLVHHFGNPRFELIRHDVVEPILLEVDQIYHLACPASPVHYKFNPVKTIISFLAFSFYFFSDI